MSGDWCCRRVPLEGEPAELAASLAGQRVFAHPRFAGLWRQKSGRPVAWLLSDGGAVLGLLPGVEFGRWPLVRLQSMPDGGYGGVLWNGFVDAERRAGGAAALLAAIRAHGYARVLVFDYYGSLAAPAGYRRQECATTVVDLPGADWEPPDSKLVSQARRAVRQGITYEPVDWSRHGEGLWRLVRHTERRHGRRRPFYPRAFYAALAELADDWPRIHWVVCEQDGRAACSHVYLLEDGVLQGWQILFDKAFSWLKPNQYLRLEIARRFAAAGIGRLNLGGTPENAPGLENYKSRWGGTARRYPAWQAARGLGRLIWR